MAIIQYTRGSNSKQTDHFKRREFDCKCGCAITKHDTALSEGLERLRNDVGKPLTVTSGYRCTKRNRAVGGASASKHTTGQAADVKSSLNPVAMGILAHRYFKAVGIYWYGGASFIHVDTRAGKMTWLCDEAGRYSYTSGQSFILPTIRKGSSGPTNRAATKLLQHLLGVSADGAFGSATDKALRSAQKKHGLTVDGICGPVSWRHISGAV